MPDDFFNQQQNQRKPRYAAGSDIDSIKTGYEVPEGGFGKKKDRSMLIAVIVGAIFFFGILPKVISLMGQSKQTTGIQVDGQGVLHEERTGNIHIATKECFVSADREKVTVQSNISNGTNKTVYNIEITYSLLNESSEEITKKNVTLSNELLAGETTNHTEIINIPPEYIGKQISLNSNVHCNVRP